MNTKEAVEVLRMFSEGKWKNRNYTWFADEDKIFSDIANLIEYLQNELTLAEIAADDNGRQVEELQAEVDNLKHDIERYIKINTELLNAEPKQGNHLDSQPPEVWDKAHENMRGYFKKAKVEANKPITLEQAIDRLRELGWLQEHDRILTEQKRGEWIGVSPFVDSKQCSICGYFIRSEVFETPYCPNCGAVMENICEVQG